MIRAAELVFHATPAALFPVRRPPHVRPPPPKALSSVFTAGRPLVDVTICFEMEENFPHMSAEAASAMFWKQELIGEIRMGRPHEGQASQRQP